MKTKIEVVTDTSVHKLAKHVEIILNIPDIEIIEVHYCVPADFYATAFIHYREKEGCEVEDEQIHTNNRWRLRKG